jgi:phospholipid/cholesterol/gamma-HCH transport system ATP-binding protein
MRKEMSGEPEEQVNTPHIRVVDLTMAYGDFVIQQDLNFTINRGEIFIIMGGSGCGKTTLLRHLIGLKRPIKGKVYYENTSFWDVNEEERNRIMRRCGILYQGSALWSSMTLAENVALPLEEYTDLSPGDISEIVSLKLAMVGLAGYEEFYPAELSGGMQKRAGLARAMALDPEILFFDEPSSGLDPVSARRLDDLILELRAGLGTTVVVVTHELASIFAIGKNSIFLDTDARTIIAQGDPHRILAETKEPKVMEFLTRGEAVAPMAKNDMEQHDNVNIG